jgi:hypothetical protein
MGQAKTSGGEPGGWRRGRRRGVTRWRSVGALPWLDGSWMLAGSVLRPRNSGMDGAGEPHSGHVRAPSRALASHTPAICAHPQESRRAKLQPHAHTGKRDDELGLEGMLTKGASHQVGAPRELPPARETA